MKRTTRTSGNSAKPSQVHTNTTPAPSFQSLLVDSPRDRRLITKELKKGLFGFTISFICMGVTAAWGFLTPVPAHQSGMRDPGWNLPTALCVLWMATGWSYFFLCLHRAAALHPSVRRSRYRSANRNPLNPKPKDHPYKKAAATDHTNMHNRSTSKAQTGTNNATS